MWDTSQSSLPKKSDSSFGQKKLLLLGALSFGIILVVIVVIAALLVARSGSTGGVSSDVLQAARETEDTIVFEGSGERDTQVLDIANKKWVVVTESRSSGEAPYAWALKEDGEPIFIPASLDGDDATEHFAMETAPGRYSLRVSPSSEASSWRVTVYKDAASAPEPSSPVEEPTPPDMEEMPEMAPPDPPKVPKVPKFD